MPYPIQESGQDEKRQQGKRIAPGSIEKWVVRRRPIREERVERLEGAGQERDTDSGDCTTSYVAGRQQHTRALVGFRNQLFGADIAVTATITPINQPPHQTSHKNGRGARNGQVNSDRKC